MFYLKHLNIECFVLLSKSCVWFVFYQRSSWLTRPRGRKRRRTCGPPLSLSERGFLSPRVCRPSLSRKTSPTSGALHCRPSQLESSKEGATFWSRLYYTKVHFWGMVNVIEFKCICCAFFFCRTSRFASFPEYLVMQIKKFTFGVDWVPKKLGNYIKAPKTWNDFRISVPLFIYQPFSQVPLLPRRGHQWTARGKLPQKQTLFSLTWLKPCPLVQLVSTCSTVQWLNVCESKFITIYNKRNQQ